MKVDETPMGQRCMKENVDQSEGKSKSGQNESGSNVGQKERRF